MENASGSRTYTTAVPTPAAMSNPMQYLGNRKHHPRNRSVGQIATPAPKLKDATSPANITISIGCKSPVPLADIFGRKRKASAPPAITKEFSQLKPPEAVITDRPIQKLPTIMTSVDILFAVRLTVLSRQIGINSSDAVIKSSASPTKKRGSWSPWKK